MAGLSEWKQSGGDQRQRRRRHHQLEQHRRERQHRERPRQIPSTSLSERQQRSTKQSKAKQSYNGESQQISLRRRRDERLSKHREQQARSPPQTRQDYDVETRRKDPKQHSTEALFFSFPWSWNNNKFEAEKRGGKTTESTSIAPSPQLTVRHSRVDINDTKQRAKTPNFNYISHTQNAKIERGRSESLDSKDRGNGVPSVVFAITDVDEDERSESSPTNTTTIEEEDKIKSLKRKLDLKRDPFLPEEQQPISPPAHLREGHEDDPILCSESLAGSLMNNPQQREQVRSNHTINYPGQTLSSSNYSGKKHDLCHDRTAQLKSMNYRKMLRKQTIHDLTALESLSTYDLEQRHKSKEPHSILQATAREGMTLPHLVSPNDQTAYRSRNSTHPIVTDKRQKQKHPVPSTTVFEGKLIYNLSDVDAELEQTNQKRQAKHLQRHGMNLNTKVESVTASLQKMKTKLRHKQSMLSNAMSDLKSKQDAEKKREDEANRANQRRQQQKQQQTPPQNSSRVERVRKKGSNKMSTLSPSPSLNQNQSYISDIFSDIASKMNFRPSSPEPYIPKVSSILHSHQKHQAAQTQQQEKGYSNLNNEKPAQDNGHGIRLRDRNREHKRRHKREQEEHAMQERERQKKVRSEDMTGEYDEVAPNDKKWPSFYYSQIRGNPLYGNDRSDRRRRTIGSPRNSNAHDNEGTELADNNLHGPQALSTHCGLAASPMAEQFNRLVSPKSYSSLYLPTIRSRRSTPVPDRNLPFRPGVVTASASKELFQRCKTKFPAVRDIIDVTSQASSHNHNPFYDYFDAWDDHEYNPFYIYPPRWQHKKHATQQQPFYPMKQLQQDIIDVTSQVSKGAFSISSTQQSLVKDIIDVTSLASSLLSHTTVKKVICLDEDSQGYIHAKKKLTAMPKRPSCPAQRGVGKYFQGKRRESKRNWEHYHLDWNRDYKKYKQFQQQERKKEQEIKKNQQDDKYSDSQGIGQTLTTYEEDKLANDQSRTRKQNLELKDLREQEQEIVFTQSLEGQNDSEKGLFEGIWDMELPTLFFKSKNKEAPPPAAARHSESLDLPSLKSKRSDLRSSSTVSPLGLRSPASLSLYSKTTKDQRQKRRTPVRSRSPLPPNRRSSEPQSRCEPEDPASVQFEYPGGVSNVESLAMYSQREVRGPTPMKDGILSPMDASRSPTPMIDGQRSSVDAFSRADLSMSRPDDSRGVSPLASPVKDGHLSPVVNTSPRNYAEPRIQSPRQTISRDASPVTSPALSLTRSPAGSPVASYAGSPLLSRAGSPVMSHNGSPVVSHARSPVIVPAVSPVYSGGVSPVMSRPGSPILSRNGSLKYTRTTTCSQVSPSRANSPDGQPALNRVQYPFESSAKRTASPTEKAFPNSDRNFTLDASPEQSGSQFDRAVPNLRSPMEASETRATTPFARQSLSSRNRYLREETPTQLIRSPLSRPLMSGLRSPGDPFPRQPTGGIARDHLCMIRSPMEASENRNTHQTALKREARDPSVLPWTKRSWLPHLSGRRDAPIEVGKQREPEGTRTDGPAAKARTNLSPSTDENYEDGDSSYEEDTEETDDGTEDSRERRRERNLNSVAVSQRRPEKNRLPTSPSSSLRKGSLLGKAKSNSVRSTETRSVTFQEGTLLGSPKKVPEVILTDASSDIAVTRRQDKSTRRGDHPWDQLTKASTASSRKAFSDLSIREMEGDRHYDLAATHKLKNSSKSRRQDEKRYLSPRKRDSRSEKTKHHQARLSMYDEVVNRARKSNNEGVIVLDEEPSVRFEIFPSSDSVNTRNKLWEDVSEQLSRNYKDHNGGNLWTGASQGESNILPQHRSMSEAETSRSPRGGKRNSNSGRRRERGKEQALFFDFLCF